MCSSNSQFLNRRYLNNISIKDQSIKLHKLSDQPEVSYSHQDNDFKTNKPLAIKFEGVNK